MICTYIVAFIVKWVFATDCLCTHMYVDHEVSYVRFIYVQVH